MLYSFEGQLISEGSRSFIEIPFNVWDETGLKGNLPARVKVNDCVFECKLVPKGKGCHYIPVNKSYAGSLEGLLDVSIEFIASLSRINHDSPYSTERPVRIIDSIKEIDIVPGYCSHCCIAMLAGISLQDVQALMGITLARGQRSWRPWTIMESAILKKWFTLKETMYACQSAVLHILMAALISGIRDGSMVLQ